MTASPASQAGLDLVLFRSGGLTCAIEASLVSGLRGSGTAPLAMPLAESFELPPAPSAASPARARQLRVRQGQGERWFIVEEPLRHQYAPTTALHPLPPLVAARCRFPGVRALAWLGDEASGMLAIVLDPRLPPLATASP